MHKKSKILCKSDQSRFFKDESDDFPYLLDRKRIVQSSAFRRLGYKTQVFVNFIGDHHRTRLTHTIDVANIAKIIARHLECDEDLAENIALCHDIGHPPFGHAGEDALSEATRLYGGFDHNAHALKILTQIEVISENFQGLNLTFDLLDGIAKHNGSFKSGVDCKLHSNLLKIAKNIGINMEESPSLEAQIAAIADDIAYVTHDIEDGIRAQLIDLHSIYEIEQLKDLIPANKLELGFTQGFTQALQNIFIADLIEQSKRNLHDHNIETDSDVKNCKTDLIIFSPGINSLKDDIKTFLMSNVYRHYKINRMSHKARKIVTAMYNEFSMHPESLPKSWRNKSYPLHEIIIDYIAGMTDRFAIKEHKKLFDPNIF